MIELARRFTDTNVDFEIAGSGPLLEQCRQEVQDAEVDNITFRGFVDDLPAFLRNGDVYVQPSTSEGLCVTVPEAMACGLPVVGSAVGGIPESVVEGETGYLVDPHDVEGFESRIRELLEDAPQRDRFGRRGRDRVEERYSQRVLVGEFEQLLLDIAGE
jgi:glycosyltransferase involved in cell wall biosynthesis